MILHISTREQWAAAQRAGEIRAPSLSEAGFLHCSDPGTVHLPANRLYHGRTDLLLLEIDPRLVGADVRWEPGDPPIENGPWFPHVYGPIECQAVVEVHEFPPGADGTFQLAENLLVR